MTLIKVLYASDLSAVNMTQYTIDSNGSLLINRDFPVDINTILGNLGPDEIKKIKKLDLFQSGLEEVPSNIKRLGNLEILDLHSNKLSKIRKDAFKGLSSLKKLLINSNQITEIENGAFKGLLNLEILSLHHNHLKMIKLNTFKVLPKLENLSVKNNKITEIEAGGFEELSSLQKLFLGCNQITKIKNGTFKGLRNLKELCLNENSIAEINHHIFEELPSLQILGLQNNQITKIVRGMFKELPNLKELYLSGNQIRRIKNDGFAGLFNLQILGLQNNKISEINSEMLRGLSKLQVLGLYNNKISRINGGTFKETPKLEKLSVSDNQISLIEDCAFNGLSSLKELYLNDTQVAKINCQIFKGLPSLLKLNLDNSQITEIEDGSFDGLSSLECLCLNNNKLAEINRYTFKGVINLSTLDLHNNQISEIRCQTFKEVPLLKKLYLCHNQTTEISSCMFEELPNLNTLYLNNNNLTMLPASVKNLARSLTLLNLEYNPNLSLESADGMLGSRDLRSIFGNKVIFDLQKFLEEYTTRKSLHWNLENLKELKLLEVEDLSVGMDEMLEIIDKLLPTDEKKSIKENIKDYIQRIHGKEMITPRKWPMIKKEDFPLAIKLLGNILKQLSDNGNGDVAKLNLFVVSKGMTKCPHGQIAALNDAYALINRDYNSQSGDIVDILKHRIAVLKDSTFKLLVTPPNSEHNVHMLNYWMIKMKDTLGFRMNLEIEAEGILPDDMFGGNSAAVLLEFLDGVFTPDKVVDVLTSEINGDKMLMKNSLLYFIFKDESLTDEEKEKLQPNILNTYSDLYKSTGGVTVDAVKYVLTKMGLLVTYKNC